MSLIDAYTEDFIRMEPARAPDGSGGGKRSGRTVVPFGRRLGATQAPRPGSLRPPGR